jgi:hypothetical protein
MAKLTDLHFGPTPRDGTHPVEVRDLLTQLGRIPKPKSTSLRQEVTLEAWALVRIRIRGGLLSIPGSVAGRLAQHS